MPLKQVQDEITFPRLKFLGFQPIPEGTTLPGFDGASWRPVFGLVDDVQCPQRTMVLLPRAGRGVGAEHGVGVRLRRAVEFKRLDENFFDEDE